MAKQYAIVLKATKRADVAGVEMEGRKMPFGTKSNAFTINDMGLAREIEAEHGARETGEVVVIRQPKLEAGHHYTFQVPELPWKRKERENHGTTD
mgnify:CR=1 FL=1